MLEKTIKRLDKLSEVLAENEAELAKNLIIERFGNDQLRVLIKQAFEQANSDYEQKIIKTVIIVCILISLCQTAIITTVILSISNT